MSPFVTLLAHPHLAVHVQSIDTWTSFFFLCVYFWNIFTYRTANRFTSHCKISSTSSLCTLMRRCYSEKQKLETILLHYSQLSGYLFTVFAREESTGTHANLTTDRARMPTNFEKLKSLSPKFASLLIYSPGGQVFYKRYWLISSTWASAAPFVFVRLFIFLHFLTTRLSDDHWPQPKSPGISTCPFSSLVGLHLVGCPKIGHTTVLRMHHRWQQPLVSSKILLIHLCWAFNCRWTRPLVFPPLPLCNLRNLALDTRYNSSPSPSPAILATMLANIKFSLPPLTSFVIKIQEREVVVAEAFITQLLENHSHTLRKLAFLDCGVTQASITEICRCCLHLERLDAAIIMKEIVCSSCPCSKSRNIITSQGIVCTTSLFGGSV